MELSVSSVHRSTLSAKQRSRQLALVWQVVFALVVGSGWNAVDAVPARAEYRLNPGDTLEISATGLSELRQQTTIDPDGTALFPLVGSIKAAGLSLSELRTKLGETLPGKVFRRRTAEGREFPVVITSDDVIITVTEYRPIYLDGDVAKPGAQTYRAGMTVRQALALAGGYDVMRFRGRDPFLESSDFRAEYFALWTEFAKEQAHISRLRAELDGDTKLDKEGFLETPIPQAIASQIQELEAEQLLARNADRIKEKDHLGRAIGQEEHRISILKQQQQGEQEGAQADAKDLAEMRENFKRGIVPITRMSESRRLALFSATQALQTGSMLAQAERQREDLSRRLERVDDERRMSLLSDLQDAQINLQTIRARLQAVGDKLLYSSIVRSQLVRGSGGTPTVKVFRDSNGDRQTLAATEDTELMPGDVVEVAVRLGNAALGQPQ